MTTEQIKYSIENNKLKLNNWEKFTHYGIVFFILFIPTSFILLHLKYYFQENPKSIENGEIISGVICSIFAYIFYKIQKRRLRFKIVETKLKNEEIKKVIEDVANKLKWTLSSVNKKSIIAKTHPGFLTGSWGEQITIIFNNDKVLINSICDLDKRSSVVSYGQNKKNIEVLVEEINKASR